MEEILAFLSSWLGFVSGFVQCFYRKNLFMRSYFSLFSWRPIFFYSWTLTEHDCDEKAVSSLGLRSEVWPPFSFSLFCSVEKPPHAHRDQLLHREPLLRWRAGHHHLPAGQSGGGHHRDLVLWEDALQNCAIFTGTRSFRNTILVPTCWRLTHPCMLLTTITESV